MTGWNREYLENKEEYLELFDRIMQQEQEKNIEFLEKSVVNLVGRKFAVACGSGTDALHFALIGLGIQKDDEVLCTNFSWISSASCISMVGATPVFCDVNLDTYHISLDSIKRMVSNKTKAIIYPFLFGNVTDVTEILAFCKERNIAFIEDACQALGSSYKGQKAGTFGDISTLSFNANKVVAGIAGGGMVMTDNKEHADLFRKLRRHGNNETLGYNSKMLLANAMFIDFRLKKIDLWQEKRQAIAAKYDEVLKDLPVVIQKPSDCDHNYHKYVVRFEDTETRDLVKKQLNASVHYGLSLSDNPMYKYLYHRKDLCVNSTQISKTILSLPMNPHLTDEEINEVLNTIMILV
jgi:dTDP-4-amino-4,6-dideoxygalactose transaminase